MKKSLVSLIYLLLSTQLWAQSNVQIVRGRITDHETLQKISGAKITIISNTEHSDTSDLNGEFEIKNIEIGRIKVAVQKQGYSNVIMDNLVLNSAKELVLEISMNAVLQMDAVYINKRQHDQTGSINEMVQVSGRQFSADQTQRFAGSLFDPSRMAANFAGVNAGGGQRNDIVVRGNSPMGLLWRLDGIDIPNPNHFSSQGATGGPISILNNNNLANSDFITSAFPAEYGNAMGAVFDLRMRNGNYAKHEFMGQVGFNGFEAGAEGPISRTRKSSYVANYRYSTLGVFDALGIKIGFGGVPQYQDYTVKLNFGNTRTGQWQLSSIGGKSSISLLYKNRDSSDLSFGFSVPNNLVNGSAMMANILSNTQKIKNGYIKTIVAYTYEKRTTTFDTINAIGNTFNTYAENTATNKGLLHSYLNKRYGKWVLKAGAIGSLQNARVKDSLYSDSFKQYSYLRNINKTISKLQAYIQTKYSYNKNLVFTAGLHHQHLFFNQTYSIEPRLAASYKVGRKTSINAGLGSHAQQQPLEIYFGETYNFATQVYTQTNTKLKMSQSKHAVVGLDHVFNSYMRLKVESYYQQLNQVPVSTTQPFSVLNLGADFGGLPVVNNLQNNGKGTNYGVELTLERFFHKQYYYLLTASIYDSKYTDNNGIKRNTAFNSNYVVNALAGYELKLGKNKTNIVGFNFKSTAAGGRRYTPLDLVKSEQQGSTVYQTQNPYSAQFKNYYRTDFKISFKLNGKKTTQEWALDIQNILDAQNPLTNTYNRKTKAQAIEYQQGRLPMMFYRIQF